MTLIEKMAAAIIDRGGRTEYGAVIPEGLGPELARAALLAIRDAESPDLAGLLSLSLEEVVDAILNEKSPSPPK